MGIVRNLLIGILFASILASMFTLWLAEANQDYGTNIDLGALQTGNITDEIVETSNTIQQRLDVGTEISTLDSVGALVQAGFISTKLAFLALPLGSALLTQAAAILGIHPLIITLGVVAMTLIVAFAVIQILTGRVIE